MRKLLSGLVVMVALLGNGCGTRVVQKPSPPCWTPEWPEYPDITLVPCKNDETETCMTADSAVDLGLWVRAVIDYHNHVLACPGIER